MNITGPALLTAHDLALAYGHQRLLEAVTLLVAPGEKVGLLGRNGCGKTSLLRILAGHQHADAGDVARRRGLRIGYLPQDFRSGETVGLRGRNGCGKTSLLRILAGHQHADAGDVARRRGLRIGYLPQEFELDGKLTVRQNIEAGAADLMEWLRRYESGHGTDKELAVLLNHIESADGWKLQTRINATASALAAPPLDTLVGPLSGGGGRIDAS